jgi:hypothetical protein
MDPTLLSPFTDIDSSPELLAAVHAHFGEGGAPNPYPLASKLAGLWRADPAKARQLVTNVLEQVDWAALSAGPGATPEDHARIMRDKLQAELRLTSLFPERPEVGPVGIRYQTYRELANIVGRGTEAASRIVDVLTFGEGNRSVLVAALRESSGKLFGGAIGASEVDLRLAEVVLDALGTRDPAVVLPKFLDGPQFAMLERLCAALFATDLPLFTEADTYNRCEAIVFRLAEGAPKVLESLFPDLLESWSYVLPEAKWHLTDYATLDQDEVAVGAAEYFQIRRFGTCVVTRTGKHGAGGRLSVKTHKTEAAAQKDYDKRKAAGADKVKAQPVAYDLHGSHESHGISTSLPYTVTDPKTMLTYATFRNYAALAARARKEGATNLQEVPADAKHPMMRRLLGTI